MASHTVSQLAAELGKPLNLLQEQLQQAGVGARAADDAIGIPERLPASLEFSARAENSVRHGRP